MINIKKKSLIFVIIILSIFVSIFTFNLLGYAATLFSTGLETGDTQATWNNTAETNVNITGYTIGINPECAKRTGEQYHSGTAALMYAGTDNDTISSHIYFKVFDVNIAVTSDAKLSYWFYPQQELGRHVAVDFVCTDGSTLRDSGATDYNGITMHPGTARGTINTWNQIQCDIGRWLNGKTIDRILVGYDYNPSTGPFRGYIDDIFITNGGATPTPTPTPTPVPQVVLDNCNSTTGWSGTDAVSLDTTDKKEGTASLKKTGIGTSWFYKVFSTPVNSGVTEANGYLHLWLYVSDDTKMGTGQIEITSSGAADVNEYNWSLSGATLVNGWNELNLKISSAAKSGTPNLGAINFFRVYNPLTASVTCKVDNIYFYTSTGPTPTPAPTPTPIGNIKLRFVVVGDSRAADDNGWYNGTDDGTNEQTIISIMNKIKLVNPMPSFMVSVGDLINGGINGGEYNKMTSQLTNWKTHVTSDVGMPSSFHYPMVGNHDCKTSEEGEHAFADVFANMFSKVPSGNFCTAYNAGQTYQKKSIYYVDIGETRLFMLNSHLPGGEAHKITGAQYSWLQSKIDATKKNNIFFVHEPAYGTWKANNSLDMYPTERNKFVQLTNTANRPMVFVAHEHMYTRRHVNSTFNAGYTKNVYHITNGGFGGPLNSGMAGDTRNVDVAPINKYHFVVVDIKTDNSYEVTAIDINGNQIDHFTQTSW